MAFTDADRKKAIKVRAANAKKRATLKKLVTEHLPLDAIPDMRKKPAQKGGSPKASNEAKLQLIARLIVAVAREL